MTETLAPISPEAYVKQVLPLTAPLWANGRAFDAYAAQTLELARTPYGKRNYSTLGFRVNRTIVSSFKRYERMARLGTQRLASIGIGAVLWITKSPAMRTEPLDLGTMAPVDETLSPASDVGI